VALKVGFTGSRIGLNSVQREIVRKILVHHFTHGSEFRHGECVGSDVEAAAIAKRIGYKVIAYPGYPGNNPRNLQFRGHFAGNDVVMPPSEFITRNRLIVDASEMLIGAPKELTEVLRSGTWAAIRYALKSGKPTMVVHRS